MKTYFEKVGRCNRYFTIAVRDDNGVCTRTIECDNNHINIYTRESAADAWQHTHHEHMQGKCARELRDIVVASLELAGVENGNPNVRAFREAIAICETEEEKRTVCAAVCGAVAR